MQARDILDTTHQLEDSVMTRAQTETIAQTVAAAVKPLATKEELAAAIEPLATKKDMETLTCNCMNRVYDAERNVIVFQIILL